MTDLIVKNHELLNINFNVGDTSRELVFPDNPKIRDVELESIEVWHNGLSLLSPTGVPLVTIVILQTTYITLENYDGRQFVKQMPVLEFLSNWFGVGTGENLLKKFNHQRVNWPKSFITWNDGGVPPVAAFQWQFSIFYKDMQSIENTNKQASFKNQS